MKILCIDAFAGAAGDMFAAALVDLGLPAGEASSAVAALGLPGLSIRFEPAFRSGLRATRCLVSAPDGQPERDFAAIRTLLEEAPLAPGVRDRTVAIFALLARAEGRIHGVPPERVHFHEIGAADSLADIVATAALLETGRFEAVWTGPVYAGGGTVVCEHGLLPVPAPAALELLAGFEIEVDPGAGEHLTPTGAAIIAATARPGRPPRFVVGATGYGAGGREGGGRPNVLRVTAGETGPDAGRDDLVQLESNIDDATPEMLGHLMERLFSAGAVDVWFVPVLMKKSRPAVTLCVLVGQDGLDRLLDTVFAESTAIGARWHPVRRRCLTRELRPVKVRGETVRVKVARDGQGRPLNLAPEFDDCRAAALRLGLPAKQVWQEALAAAVEEGRSGWG